MRGLAYMFALDHFAPEVRTEDSTVSVLDVARGIALVCDQKPYLAGVRVSIALGRADTFNMCPWQELVLGVN